MKSCEDIEALIDAYLDGELTREHNKLFETHISSCDSCREALEFARSIRQTLITLPEIDLPEDFSENLRKRIEKECKPQRSFGTYARKYGALAACVVLAVVIGGGLGNMDFTEKGTEYDNFVVEGTPVPMPVSDLEQGISEQNAGEEVAPTKEERVSVTPVSDKTEIKTDVAKKLPELKEKVVVTVPSPTPEAIEETSAPTEMTVNAALNTEADGESIAVEDIPLQTALTEDESIPSPTVETAASGGGGGGSARAFAENIAPAITIAVSGEHTLVAISLAEEFATVENGVYTTDKANFDKMLEAFDIGGISYTRNGTADSDIVTFAIYTE
ncbi:MAG: zf-HC2 domain-containing protein [Eubacteriales bacterium]|nr:zf-HC2 domain-containing protein [Eubacteriales bacterium]